MEPMDVREPTAGGLPRLEESSLDGYSLLRREDMVPAPPELLQGSRRGQLSEGAARGGAQGLFCLHFASIPPPNVAHRGATQCSALATLLTCSHRRQDVALSWPLREVAGNDGRTQRKPVGARGSEKSGALLACPNLGPSSLSLRPYLRTEAL